MINDVLHELGTNTYHLSCPECGKTWWSKEAFPKECPYCHSNRRISLGENKDIKII